MAGVQTSHQNLNDLMNDGLIVFIDPDYMYIDTKIKYISVSQNEI